MRSIGDYMDDQKDRAELLLFNYEVWIERLSQLHQLF
jgi:hypothetical protein